MKPWLSLEVERVKRLAEAGHTRAEIAAALGRSLGSVSNWLERNGVRTGPPRLTPAQRREVARLHARGLTDPRIAARMGLHRTTVARARRALGLPGVSKSAAGRLGWAAHLAAHDGRPFSAIRADRERLAVARLGWPAGTTPAGARVLERLEAGDRTVAAVATALGIRRQPTWATLKALREIGAVELVGRPGSRTSTWRLTAETVTRRAAVPRTA